MLIMLGATETFTFSHCSGFVSFNVVSMAVFSTSMPVGWLTKVEPKYWAFSTFFGSSIGVGNDCANKQNAEVSISIIQIPTTFIQIIEWECVCVRAVMSVRWMVLFNFLSVCNWTRTRHIKSILMNPYTETRVHMHGPLCGSLTMSSPSSILSWQIGWSCCTSRLVSMHATTVWVDLQGSLNHYSLADITTQREKRKKPKLCTFRFVPL